MKIRQFAKISTFLLSIAVLTSSCGNTDTNRNTDTASTPSTKPSEEPLKGCYIAVIKRDTFQLAITEVKGNQISGSLIYNFWEKDRSKGTFTGEYNNGILMANYVFNAEGTTSERPVVFKKVPEGFVEGFGETKTKGSKEVFANPDAVEFGQSYTLKHTDICLP